MFSTIFPRRVSIGLMFAFIPWPPINGQNSSHFRDGKVLPIAFEQDCGHISQSFQAVVAHGDKARQKGLSERKEPLKANEAMIFIFDKSEPVGFWMKRTLIPLQVVFADLHSNITGDYEMPVEADPNYPQKIYQSTHPTVAAVELAPHTIQVKPGLHLCVDLSETKNQK